MVGGYRVKVWYVGQPLECDICSRGDISRDCPMRGKCRHCGKPRHLARACKNPPRVCDVLTQNNDESSSSSASVDPTPAEAAQISSGTGSSGEPSLSCSMFSGIGADLVSGGCDWGDLPAPEEGNPFSLSASDSDSSLGSHVSPSLSKRSSTSANNDQSKSKSNGNSKNDSDKRNNDTDKSSSMDVSDKCRRKNDSDKRSNSSNSKYDTGNSSSKNVSDKCSSKNNSDKGSNSSNSKNDTDKRSSNNDSVQRTGNSNDQNDIESMDATSGAVLDSASEVTDVAMSDSRLGKRVFSDVETSTDGDSTGSGAIPAPKKGTGKPTSRVKKVASSESARKGLTPSPLSRRSC